jgi:hypothetical protein
MLYDIARQQQAEEVARAEHRRRRPRPAERRHLAVGLRLAASPRRRLARLTGAFGVVVPHHRAS